MKQIKTAIAVLMATFAMQATAQDIKIEASQLPAAVHSFLESHFKGNAVNLAIIDQDKAKKKYEVRLADGTELEFTEKGDWKEVDGKHRNIPTAFIPSPITEYAAKHYPNEKITKVDKSWHKIEIELTNKIELQFDTAGKFIKIDK